MEMSFGFLITMLIVMFTVTYITVRSEVPKLLKFKREQWETEEEAKTKTKNAIETHNNKQDAEIRRIAQEENNKTLQENRKNMYKDNVRKGRDYELFVTDHFRKQGYQIKPFGILNGRKDKGIDVIIKKNKEITLIQCKNWKADSSYKVKHKDLKEFLGNTTAFLENHKDKADGYTIKRLYVTSNDVLDNSARYFLRDNKIVEHRVIPM